MKKTILALFVLLGLIHTASALPNDTMLATSKCKFSLNDATKQLASFKFVNFIPKSLSPDGTKVMGLKLFHDPKNSEQESIDAAALVIVSKTDQSKELILVVAYLHGTELVKFERELKLVKKEDGSTEETFTPCFNKRTEKAPQNKSE